MIELEIRASSEPDVMVLSRMTEAPIPRGWYLLEQDTTNGRLLKLRCGPQREWQSLCAEAGRDGASLVLVEQEQPWLEASVAGVEEAADEPKCRITRIGRLHATWIMLRAIAGSRGSARKACTVAWTIASTAMMFNARLALRHLFEQYQTSLDGVDRGFRHRTWRLRGSGSAALVVSPAAHAAGIATPDGRFAWRADGERARLRISRHDDGQPVLRAGWYRLRGQLDISSGAWEGPQFSIRYVGLKQPLPVPLRIPEPDATGRINALILFDHDVTVLDLEPSVSAVRFGMIGFSLHRLGKARWPLALLSSLRTPRGRRDWLGIAKVMVRSATHLLRGQPRLVGTELAAAHHEANRNHTRSYELWIAKYDSITDADLAHLLDQGESLASSGPLISVLLPVFNTPEAWLRRCLDSVIGQAYPKWELCVADDASTLPYIDEVLHEYARRDVRIRVARRPVNGHIAEASNTALSMATGAYIALLDHDDELRPHALLEMAEAIVADPRRLVLYSDEDKIDALGRRFQPYFKPDWNPDLLLAQNYMCHLTVIEAALARSAGGFRRGFEGSQDHDLVLRCTVNLTTVQIHHVSKVLYHWRAIPGSTALSRNAKDYAAIAGVRAVAEHVRRTGSTVTVDQLEHGHYRVRWPLPAVQPKVCVIIPTRDRADLLRTCVESALASTAYDNFECIVVDNQSTETETLDYLEELRSRQGVRVLEYDAPFNYSRINNWAVAQCDGELVCLLNNDIQVIDPGWMTELAGQALRPGIGAVGAMLYYPDGTIQHAGVVLGLGGIANHLYSHQPVGYQGHGARALVSQNLSAVTGACLMVRRAIYESIGGLDEKLEVAFNDIDFCLRLQEAGFRNVWTPFASLVHHESASRGADDTISKQQRFLTEVAHMEERWGSLLRRDPAYNRNLSLNSVNSGLSFPPRTTDDPALQEIKP